jgi:hypothetical protein
MPTLRMIVGSFLHTETELSCHQLKHYDFLGSMMPKHIACLFQTLGVCDKNNGVDIKWHQSGTLLQRPEAVFLVMCNPSMNEL